MPDLFSPPSTVNWDTSFESFLNQIQTGPTGRTIGQVIHPRDGTAKCWRDLFLPYLRAKLGCTKADDQSVRILNAAGVEARAALICRFGGCYRTSFQLCTWAGIGAAVLKIDPAQHELDQATRDADVLKRSWVPAAIWKGLSETITPYASNPQTSTPAALEALSSAFDDCYAFRTLCKQAIRVRELHIKMPTDPEFILGDPPIPYLTGLDTNHATENQAKLASLLGLTMQWDLGTLKFAIASNPKLNALVASEPLDPLAVLFLEQHAVSYADHLLRVFLRSKNTQAHFKADAIKPEDVSKMTFIQLCCYFDKLIAINRSKYEEDYKPGGPAASIETLQKAYFPPSTLPTHLTRRPPENHVFLVDLKEVVDVVTPNGSIPSPFPTFITDRFEIDLGPPSSGAPIRFLVNEPYSTHIAITDTKPVDGSHTYRRLAPMLIPLPPIALPSTAIVVRPIPVPPELTYPPFAIKLIQEILQSHPATASLTSLAEMIDPMVFRSEPALE